MSAAATPARRHRALFGRPTRYEIVVKLGSALFCAGYGRRRGRAELVRVATPVPDNLLAVAGVLLESTVAYTAKGGWSSTDGAIRIYYGRTERTALQEGEHPPLRGVVALAGEEYLARGDA